MATVDNVPAGRVPSDATVDANLDGCECSGRISPECELSMVAWTSIEAAISVYVTALTQSLREQELTPPTWDAVQIARQATGEAQAQLDDASTSRKSSAYVLAVNEAHTQMARSLNWAAVTEAVTQYLRYQWPVLQDADIDEIANDAAMKTLQKWAPILENNWELPGKNLAIGVARNQAREVVRLREKEEVNDREPKPDPPKPANHILLDQWFDREKLTWRERAAFIARFIHGLPTFVAGAIISDGETRDACRAAWDRKRNAWLPSLRRFLGIP